MTKETAIVKHGSIDEELCNRVLEKHPSLGGLIVKNLSEIATGERGYIFNEKLDAAERLRTNAGLACNLNPEDRMTLLKFANHVIQAEKGQESERM